MRTVGGDRFTLDLKEVEIVVFRGSIQAGVERDRHVCFRINTLGGKVWIHLKTPPHVIYVLKSSTCIWKKNHCLKIVLNAVFTLKKTKQKSFLKYVEVLNNLKKLDNL